MRWIDGEEPPAMKEPRDEMLDHEFDGIREYNNPPPNWIMYILYGTLGFAIVYWFVWHVVGGAPFPVDSYNAEVARAAEVQLARMTNQELNDEALQLMSVIPAQVTDGKKLFDQFCVACHAADGSGNVGPNLTDGYWLYGGKPMQILATVTNGVPAKGMVSWRDQLGPVRIQKVTAYLLTLRGKNLPGKAPQGDPEPVGGAAAAPAAGAAPGAKGAM
jgi:cytochrome c oxidase cbb3-type subunit 3